MESMEILKSRFGSLHNLKVFFKRKCFGLYVVEVNGVNWVMEDDTYEQL